MTVRGNWTFARNNVTYWEQSGVVYPYQSFVDVPYGVQRGLISLGLFKDQADIESSPVQTYSSDVRPILRLFSMVLLLNSDTNSLLPAFSLKV